MKERAGPVGAAQHVKTELDSFLLFLDDEMLTLIVERTNLEIAKKRVAGDNTPRHSFIDMNELKAFIGILIFRGLHRDVKNPASELWGDPDSQRPLYRAIGRSICENS